MVGNVGPALGRDVPARVSASAAAYACGCTGCANPPRALAACTAAHGSQSGMQPGNWGTLTGCRQFTTPQQIQLPVAAAGASPSTGQSKIQGPKQSRWLRYDS